MTIGFFRIFAILCTAVICGKLISKLKLPAILGWLITGIVFGPYLAEIVTLQITDALWYKIFIKIFECFAGVMIGREIIFKKIASSGKQIIGITFIQSIGTFLFVTAAFSLVFIITDIPIYLAFIFGGIALATAPAPALSIVNEYHTNGPVTKTLIPLAAILYGDISNKRSKRQRIFVPHCNCGNRFTAVYYRYFNRNLCFISNKKIKK